MALFDTEPLYAALVTRYQEAVTAGLLKWAGRITDERDASKQPKHPGVSVLLRRGRFSPSKTVGHVTQEGVVTWSVFAGGVSSRERGVRPGMLGATGADHALMVAIQYAVGFEIAPGFPLALTDFEVASIERAKGFAVYEVTFEHDYEIVEGD